MIKFDPAMENVRQILIQFWVTFSARIETFYKDHAGLVVLVGLLGTWAAVHYSRRALQRPTFKTSETSPPQFDSALRLRLLEKVKNERVDPRLCQGLREAIRVDLGLTVTPGAVQATLRIYANLESGTDEDLPIDMPIWELFNDAACGRLLILGEPGTGKTNLLLELADSLIAEAKQDQTRPIPAVFSLSRWILGERARSVAEWLKDDLVSEYGLSAAAADLLLRHDGLLPLLDGLDELAEGRRAACVQAIHAYQQSRSLGPLAVCCRLDQYVELPRLALGTAVRVEKLMRTDLEREIGKPGLEYVRRALEHDPELWEVVDTPLWLHVLFGAAQIEWSRAEPFSPPMNPRDRLYAWYVEYALRRDPDGSPRKRTAREPLLHWLGWLAAEMRLRDQAQFALEDLNFAWIPTRRAQSAAQWFLHLFGAFVVGLLVGLVVRIGGGVVGGFVGGMVGGLVLGLGRGLLNGIRWLDDRSVRALFLHLAGGLFVGLVAALFMGPVVGLFLGLFGGLFGWLFGWQWGAEKTDAIEELRFSWREAKQGLFSGLFGGLVLGLFSGLFVGLAGGLVVGLVVGPTVWLAHVLKPQPMSERSAPNRGTMRSLRYALWIGLSGCVTFIVIGIVVQDPLSGQGHTGLAGLVAGAGAAGAIMLSFNKGGWFVLRHFTVRLFLWLYGVAPLRYVRLLNEGTERLFLIRRGGSYEFFHLTFRDYLAERHTSSRPI